MVHFISGRDRHKLIKIVCDELAVDNVRDILLGRIGDRDITKQGKITLASGGTLLFVGVDRLKPGLESLIKKILGEAGIYGKGNSGGSNREITFHIKEISGRNVSGGI